LPVQGSHDTAGLLRLRAEHWKHLRTSNPIESSFATVRHRTLRSKGRLSNKTALAMIFKLAQAAEKSWRRLNGHNLGWTTPDRASGQLKAVMTVS
jgi:transposase-like protein